jgi:hypothetical protein
MRSDCWFAWLIGLAVGILMALVMCRKRCIRCPHAEDCDMANLDP